MDWIIFLIVIAVIIALIALGSIFFYIILTNFWVSTIGSFILNAVAIIGCLIGMFDWLKVAFILFAAEYLFICFHRGVPEETDSYIKENYTKGTIELGTFGGIIETAILSALISFVGGIFLKETNEYLIIIIPAVFILFTIVRTVKHFTSYLRIWDIGFPLFVTLAALVGFCAMAVAAVANLVVNVKLYDTTLMVALVAIFIASYALLGKKFIYQSADYDKPRGGLYEEYDEDFDKNLKQDFERSTFGTGITLFLSVIITLAEWLACILIPYVGPFIGLIGPIIFGVIGIICIKAILTD